MVHRIVSSSLSAALLGAAVLLALPRPQAAAAPISIPVLVITTYETGKDRGDTPGELQYWAERQDLSQEIKVPGVDHPLLTNGKDSTRWSLARPRAAPCK